MTSRRRYQTIGRRPIREDELTSLLRTCRKNRPELEGLLLLASDSGLRVHEVASVRWKDLSTDRIRVHGKCNKIRWTVAGTDTLERLEMLREYATIKDANRIKHPGAISPIGTVRMMELMQELRAKAGIAETITWHCLRHRFACRMLAKGMTIKEVQTLLGHSRLETTSLYLHHSEDMFTRAQNAIINDEPETGIATAPRLRIVNGYGA